MDVLIIVTIAGLVGYILFERNRRQKAEAKNILLENKVESSKLEERHRIVEEEREAIKRATEALKEKGSRKDSEKTPSEIEDFWNKKGRKNE
jgi:hypothetical protein